MTITVSHAPSGGPDVEQCVAAPLTSDVDAARMWVAEVLGDLAAAAR